MSHSSIRLLQLDCSQGLLVLWQPISHLFRCFPLLTRSRLVRRDFGEKYFEDWQEHPFPTIYPSPTERKSSYWMRTNRQLLLLSANESQEPESKRLNVDKFWDFNNRIVFVLVVVAHTSTRLANHHRSLFPMALSKQWTATKKWIEFRQEQNEEWLSKGSLSQVKI